MAGLLILSSGVLGRAQISPGPLSKVHVTLDGPAHCTDCHDTAKRPPEFKCLDCHRDIRDRLAQNQGLHPALVGSDRTSRSCIRCHSDHNGADFAIVHWDTPIEKFDHRRAGYPLEGKHAGLTCQSCHKPAFIPATARSIISTKDLARTFLGLSDQCIACHNDEHRGQLASDCGQCHDSTSWKAAPRFDHQRARFALTGAHEKVACEKCHPQVQDAKPYVKYKDVPFADCAPCHSDPHRGAFQGLCRTCHVSDATWKPSRTLIGFDHSKTRYPLLGKHAGVSCDSCHKGANFKQPLPFEHCTDCHKSDPHKGQFAGRQDHGECDACHTVSGFKPSTFGVVQHAATRFPLNASHAITACAKCHLPNPNGVNYRIQDLACASCHQDVHGGQFLSAPYLNRCDSCHTESAFKPSTFTVGQHGATRYPLTGAHVSVACKDCHKQRPGAGAASGSAPFHFDDMSCTACHEDPHNGQFAVRMKTTLADGKAAGCQACHATGSWHNLKGFDHATTGFPLEQAHRAVTCDQCHKPAEPGEGVKGISYTSAPKQCSGCHEDVHGGQFSSGAQLLECRACHNIAKWKPSIFDHNTQSAFKLEGAHATVACNECHKTGSAPSGRSAIVYRPTAQQCSECHEDAHAGQFSKDGQPTECSPCHQVAHWKPSSFNHNTQSTYKLEGAHTRVACALCHKTAKEIAGKTVVFYKPTPRECAACHGWHTSEGLQ